MTSTTFRDYAFDALSGGELSIDTSGDTAVIALAINHPEFRVVYAIGKDVARELGVDLLRFSAPLTCSTYPIKYDTVIEGDPRLTIEVTDGEIEFVLPDGLLPIIDDEATDLAIRLLAWAGPDA